MRGPSLVVVVIIWLSRLTASLSSHQLDLTLSCALASETTLLPSDNGSFEKSLLAATNQISPSDDLVAAIEETLRDNNMTGDLKSLLELVEMIKNATEDGNDNSTKTEASRRFLDWIKNIFANKTGTTTSAPLTDNVATISPEADESVLLQKYLIEVLQNLTQILERLNKNIELQNDLNPLRVVPLESSLNSRSRRGKREALTKTFNVTVDTNATKASAPNISAALEPPPIPTIASSQKDINTTCIPTRRAPTESNPAVKKKLLSFLNDTFHEIASKILPVQQIKKAYANDSIFRIGYIIANIDTLEVSIMNLRNDMENNKNLWEDNKILDLFDKIMVSNKVVTSLIVSLNGLQQKSLMSSN